MITHYIQSIQSNRRKVKIQKLLGDLIEIFLDSITPEKAEEIAFAVDAGIEKVEIILDTSIKEE